YGAPDVLHVQCDSSVGSNGSHASGQDYSVLNLGCGRKHVENAINLDCTAETRPDVVHDLNVTPWPFADASFREVQGFDVVEDLNDVVRTIEEIHQVSRTHAIVRSTSP